MIQSDDTVAALQPGSSAAGNPELLLQPGISEMFEEVHALEKASSADYNRFVYDSESQMRICDRCLFINRDIEYAEPFGSLVIDRSSGKAVGFIATLSGKELKSQRLRGVMRLRREKLIETGSAVYDRFVQAGKVFSAVEENELYLSRLSVAPEYRRTGIARQLLSVVERSCRALGLDRIRLDVSHSAEPALQLYRKANFNKTGFTRVEDPTSGRKLHYRHLVKCIS